MNKVPYWINLGFTKVARIYASDRLTQGVDVEFFVDRKEWAGPGVYLLVKDEELKKIGQSANVDDRIFGQYKRISNTGNDRIREEIRTNYNSIDVYAILVPKKNYSMIGYTFPINYQKGLEEAMLHDFEKTVGRLPELNKQRN